MPCLGQARAKTRVTGQPGLGLKGKGVGLNYVGLQLVPCLITFLVLTLVPPSFRNPTLNRTALPSQPFTIPCDTLPDPTLSFTWYFNGAALMLGGSSGLTLEDNGGLTFASVQNSNEGTYTCSATNSLATTNGTVHLNVLSKSHTRRGKSV